MEKDIGTIEEMWFAKHLEKITTFVFALTFAITVGLILYANNEAKLEEYEKHGCYRVEKEYQVCGPIEGKPGFTRCETKKELVCPEVAQ